MNNNNIYSNPNSSSIATEKRTHEEEVLEENKKLKIENETLTGRIQTLEAELRKKQETASNPPYEYSNPENKFTYYHPHLKDALDQFTIETDEISFTFPKHVLNISQVWQTLFRQKNQESETKIIQLKRERVSTSEKEEPYHPKAVAHFLHCGYVKAPKIDNTTLYKPLKELPKKKASTIFKDLYEIAYEKQAPLVINECREFIAELASKSTQDCADALSLIFQLAPGTVENSSLQSDWLKGFKALLKTNQLEDMFELLQEITNRLVEINHLTLSASRTLQNSIVTLLTEYMDKPDSMTMEQFEKVSKLYIQVSPFYNYLPEALASFSKMAAKKKWFPSLNSNLELCLNGTFLCGLIRSNFGVQHENWLTSIEKEKPIFGWLLKARQMLYKDAAPETQKQVINLCDLALKQDPNCCMALTYKGKAFKILKQLNQAIESFTTLLNIEPDNHEALAQRAFLYYYSFPSDQGALKNCQRDCARLIHHLNPIHVHSSQANILKGSCHLIKKEFPEAEQAFVQVIDLKRTLFTGWWKLIMVYHCQGKLEYFAQELESKLPPSQIQTHPQSLAKQEEESSVKEGKLEQSNFDFDKIIKKLNAEDIPAILTYCYLQMGQVKNLIEIQQQTQPANPTQQPESLSEVVTTILEFYTGKENNNKNLTYNPFKVMKAHLLFQQSKISDALLFINSVIEEDPACALAWAIRAACFIYNNQLDKAFTDISQAFDLNPHDPSILAILGLYHLKKDNRQEAGKYTEEALRKSPTHPFALITKGVLLFNNKNYQSALEVFTQVTQTAPHFGLSYFNLGCCYDELGIKDHAKVNYYHALEKGFNRNKTRLKIAKIEIEEGKYQEAKIQLEQCVKSDPNNQHILRDLAICYQACREFNKGKECLEKLEKLKAEQSKPLDKQELYLLGDCYLQLGNLSLAFSYFGKALEAGYYNDQILTKIGIYKIKSGFIKEAQNQFEKALTLKDDNKEALLSLGECYLAKQKWEQAKNLFEKVVQLDSTSYLAKAHLGYCLFRQGKIEECQTQISQAIDINQLSSVTWGYSGILLIYKKDWENAYKDLTYAIALDPKNSLALAWLGICKLTNNSKEALDDLSEAIDVDGNQAIAWEGLLEYYRRGPESFQVQNTATAETISSDDFEQSSNVLFSNLGIDFNKPLKEFNPVFTDHFFDKKINDLIDSAPLPQDLANLVKNKSAYPGAWATAGAYLIFAQKMEKAFEFLTYAKQLDPQNTFSLSLLAQWHLVADQIKEATNCINQVLEIDPYNNFIQSRRLVTLLWQGESPTLIQAKLKECFNYQPHDFFASMIWQECSALQGSNKNAIDYYATGLKNYPHHSIILGFLGNFHLRQGDLEESLKFLNQACELNPRHPFAYAYLGRYYALTGNYDEAVKVLKQALQINPYYPFAWFELIECFLKNPLNFEKMIEEVIETILRQDKNNAYALAARGACLYEKDSAKGLSDFNQSLALDSNNSIALLYLAKDKIKKGHLTEAEVQIQQLLDRDRSNDQAWLETALLHCNRFNFNEGLAYAQKALALNSCNNKATYILAICHLALGNFTASKSFLFNYVKQNVNDVKGLYALARYHFVAQDKDYLERARFYLDAALQKEKDDPWIWNGWVEYFSRQADLHSGLKFFEKENQGDKRNLYGFVAKGLYCTRIGNLPKALEALEMAQHLDRKNPFVLAGFAAYYLAIGELNLAQKHLDELVQISPLNPFALVYQGDYYLQRGELKKAQEYLEKARQCQPENLEVLILLYELHLKQDAVAQQTVRDLEANIQAIYPQHPKMAALQGEDLLKKGNIVKAEQCLTIASKAYPADCKTLAYLGECYRQSGEIKKAIKYFDQALSLKPTFEFAWIRLLECYLDENLDESIKALIAKTKNDPENGYAWACLGVLRMKKDSSGKTTLEKALEKNKEIAWIRTKNYECSDAKIALRSMIRESSEFFPALFCWLNTIERFLSEKDKEEIGQINTSNNAIKKELYFATKALIWMKKGNKQAKVKFENQLQHNTQKTFLTPLTIGLLKFETTDSHLAEKNWAEGTLRTAYQQNPQDPCICAYLGLCYTQLGNINSALPYLDKAIWLDPTIEFAWTARAKCLRTQNKEDEIQIVCNYKQGIRLNPKNERLYFYLADYYMEINQFEKALSQLNISIDLKDQEGTRLKRAFCYIKLKQYPEAIADLKHLLKNNPHHIDATELLGKLYLEINQIDEAMNIYHTVIQANSNNPMGWTGAAICYQKKEDFALAIKSYEEVIECLGSKSSPSFLIWKDYGFCLMQTNKFEKALWAFEQANKIKSDDEDVVKYINSCKEKIKSK